MSDHVFDSALVNGAALLISFIVGYNIANIRARNSSPSSEKPSTSVDALNITAPMVTKKCNTYIR